MIVFCYMLEGETMRYTKMCMCFAYLVMISFLAFLVGRILPYRWFHYDRFPYKPLPFEKDGKVYLRLKINRWQKKMPDMSKIVPKLIPPKRMADPSVESITVLIKETCIAELIHAVFALVGLGGLWIWPGWGGFLFVFLYIFLGHVPFILIQRYNRPRLVKLMNRLESRKETL